MNVQAEARQQTAPERVYPLATVLNPKPYRSIRNRREAMLAAWLILVTAALAMLWLFN